MIVGLANHTILISRDGRDDYWLNIGLAFTHQDGKGLNILLQALPLPDGNGGLKLVRLIHIG